jgi:hypothetical protein
VAARGGRGSFTRGRVARHTGRPPAQRSAALAACHVAMPWADTCRRHRMATTVWCFTGTSHTLPRCGRDCRQLRGVRGFLHRRARYSIPAAYALSVVHGGCSGGVRQQCEWSHYFSSVIFFCHPQVLVSASCSSMPRMSLLLACPQRSRDHWPQHGRCCCAPH